MQTFYNNGSMDPIKPFNEDEMKKELLRKDVSHVEVFEGTEENIRKRSNFLSVKKRYQKAKK